MPDFAGAVLLKPPETRESYNRKQLTNLIRVGGKLAVLGVEDGRRAMGFWHVMRPGTFNSPISNSWAPDQQGDNLVYGKSLCGLTNVVSNGYAADWRPPIGTLCGACAELL